MFDYQALFDGISAREAAERGNDTTALNLGGLIARLRAIPGDTRILGVADAPFHSYRGYYSDLAIEPERANQTTAEALLDAALAARGAVFKGYKGGDFPMHDHSPLWLSGYGTSSGLRVVGMAATAEGLVFVVRPEDSYSDAVPEPHVSAETEDDDE